MKLLAIDTATQLCGVALTENNKPVADYRLNRKNVHNEKLLTIVQQLLHDANWTLQQLSGIAVSAGPGSFTGLRIGISAAKALAFANELPLIAVNTLDALAQIASHEVQNIAAALKARADQVYFAQFKRSENRLERRSEYELIDLSAVAERLAGDALAVCYPSEVAAKLAASGIRVAAGREAIPNPLALAELGYEQLRCGQTVDIEDFEPFYLHEFKVRQKVYEYD